MHIIERVKKHDRRNIEIKYTFPLDDKQRTVDYQTEMYLFVPASLGINRSSYTSDKFYQDERNNIRFKTPQVILRHLSEGNGSPLGRLINTINDLLENPLDGKMQESLLMNIKVFCNIFKSSLRDGCSFIIGNSRSEERGALIRNTIDDTRKAMKAFQKAEQLIRVPVVGTHLQELFHLANEYICMLADKYIFMLLDYAEKNEPEEKSKLAAFLNDLTRYRKKQDFPVASAASDNEEVLYRMSSLKKIMGEVLYIKTMTRKEGRYLDMIIPGIAAGIAMAIATALLYLSRSNVSEMTLTLFLCIVGIYIVKDRLKDWTKAFFLQRMGNFFYDFKTSLFTDKGGRLGVRRENFQFIPPDKLPEEVVRIRQRTTEPLEVARPDEQVLHTRRRIHLHSGSGRTSLKDFQVDGIHDIVRFNIGRFLARMDNPAKKICTLKNGCLTATVGRRVYHLNMVLRFTSDKIDELIKLRIILSRDGIERIGIEQTSTNNISSMTQNS